MKRKPRYSVIIVDDEEDVLQMMKTMLTQFNLFENIITCNSSSLALQKINNQEFDVIIMDNHMPNRLGLELIRTVVNFPTVKASRIIFMSGVMEDGDALVAIKMGVKHFLVKPFFRDKVFSTLKKILKF